MFLDRRRRPNGLLVTLSLACAVGVIGCHAPKSTVRIWSFDPSAPRSLEQFRPRSTTADEAGPERIRLFGAINETLRFAFAVRSDRAQLEAPRLSIGDWQSVRSDDAFLDVDVYRMHPVLTQPVPGWHVRSIPPADRVLEPLDALVPIDAPRGGMPATLRPGISYAFWVDVTIPKGTADGTYFAQLELSVQGATTVRLAIEVDVLPFVLPDNPSPTIIAELDHRRLFSHAMRGERGDPAHVIDDWRNDPRRADRDRVLEATMRLLQRHGLTPVLGDLSPIVKVDAGGEMHLDWGQYDAVVEPCLSGRWFDNRVGLSLWPIPLGPIHSTLTRRRMSEGDQAEELVRAYLDGCRRHFDEKGWLDRAYAMVPDVGSVAEAMALTPALASAVRASGGEIPVVSGACPQDPAPYGWRGFPYLDISEVVDGWCPPAQFHDATAMALQRDAGRRTWFRIDRPPFSGSISIFAPATYQRCLSWQGIQANAEVIVLGVVNRWPSAQYGSDPADCAAFDANALVYPGTPFGLDVPIPTVRLKRIRRSVQDAAYVRLLRDQGAGSIADTIAASLVKYTGTSAYRTHCGDGSRIGWVDNHAVYETARKLLGSEVLKRVSDETRTNRTQVRARAASWRRFTRATREIRFRVDGCRVWLGGTPRHRDARIECALSATNLTQGPIDATIHWTALPDGWSSSTIGAAFDALEPLHRWRGALTAQTDVLPIGPTGHLNLPLELESDDGTIQRREARVACVSAIPIAEPPVIDGDLSDWPPGATNIADSFLLIARDEEGDGSAPQARTMAITTRDERFLYIAINSWSDSVYPRATNRSNVVKYDDLIPMGGELVEVLLDPLNGGTRAPIDLYRIVVKPSGAYLVERGIDLSPPCASRLPWMADIQVAVQETSERWTVEMRIPWNRIIPSEVGVDESVWGFNVTRFDAAHREFSTWSGAHQNAYDPMSLGNLYIPAMPPHSR